MRPTFAKRFAESVPMAGVDAQAFVEYWQSAGPSAHETTTLSC